VVRIFLETLDKLIVEENYLPEQILNMDEISLFWKQMSGRAFIHREANSMPGFKVCISTTCEFNVCHPEVFNTYINIQRCVSQTQQDFIVFIIVLGQHVSILIELSSGPSKIQILT